MSFTGFYWVSARLESTKSPKNDLLLFFYRLPGFFFTGFQYVRFHSQSRMSFTGFYWVSASLQRALQMKLVFSLVYRVFTGFRDI